MQARDYSRGWLVTAIVASAVLVLAAPFIGQLRTALRAATGGNFPTLMAAIVGGAALLAVGYAARRIRDRRGFRYASIAAALLIGIAYAVFSRTGNAEVDAVERFHFIEYGLITFLFYRAWRPAADGSLFLMPLVASLTVGTFEEWLQWFIPARVGEVRDVFLNLIAIGCGLLFSVGVDPPPRLSLGMHSPSRRRLARLSVVTLLAFAGFFHSVHLGYEIHDAEAGVFRSRYAPHELRRVGEQRRQAWAINPPMTWSRLSREDQYLSEGVAHVQRRNETWQAGNVLASRHENLILERYYAPVLDTPSYLSPTGHRWPESQRLDAHSRTGPGFMIYVSDALDYPVMVWPKWAFWLAILVAAGVILRAA